MYSDAELALYLAQTQFLVALGLFNYIEILGAFRIGYFQKDTKGNIKTHKCNGCSQCISGQLKTASISKFKDFFSYLGTEYRTLSNMHPEIYKELRCGLSHEFLPSKRSFTIYHAGDGKFTKEQVNNNDLAIDAFADGAKCGVVFLNENGKEKWQIFVPKLAADFRRGVKNFITDIENNLTLHQNFFEAADQINFENF